MKHSSHYTNRQWNVLMRAMWKKINGNERHNVPHQLNIAVLDIENDCTAFGKHNRLIPAGPPVDGSDRRYTVCELLGGPGEATEQDAYEALVREWPEATGYTLVERAYWEYRGRSYVTRYFAPPKRSKLLDAILVN